MTNAGLYIPSNFKEWLPTIIVCALGAILMWGVLSSLSSGRDELAKLGLLQKQEVLSFQEKGDNIEIQWRRNPDETIITVLPKNFVSFKKSADKKNRIEFQFGLSLLQRNYLPLPPEQGSPGIILEATAKSGDLIGVVIYKP